MTGPVPPGKSITIVPDDVRELVISVFSTADRSPLGKIRGLDAQGNLKKGTHFASTGVETLRFASLYTFLETVGGLGGHQALGFGLCKFEAARVVAAAKLAEIAGDESTVSRTKTFFHFAKAPGILHLDYDPQPGALCLTAVELIAALRSAVPELAGVTLCAKPSSSSFLVGSDGACLVGASGVHVFVPVSDASRIPEFGKLIVARLWLAGHGWIKISGSGVLREATLVDDSVFSAERLCFVRATCQDGVSQRFQEFDYAPGKLDALIGWEHWLDELSQLSPSQSGELVDLKSAARLAAAPEARRIRLAWAEDGADRRCELAAAKGETVDRAAIVRSFVEQDAWVMPRDLVLHPLDKPSLTAREVLANPQRWDGHKFADPFEPDYGGDPRIAMALLSRGEPRIHSHAHGGYYCFFRSEEARLAAGALEFSDLRERRRFEAVPADEFASGPPPVWLVGGVLPLASLAVIFGAPGSGKSFFAFDLAASVALGRPWRERPVRQGRVVYVCAEGVAGFKKRIDAYRRYHEIDFRDSFHVIGGQPDLLLRDDIRDLLAVLEGLSPDLVIIDTLAQVMPGGDENSSSDMGKALKACREIHAATGGMPLLVHHSGKDADKGPRGWSGLSGAADAIITIARKGEQRLAKITKMKDGEDGLECPFKLVPVPGVGRVSDENTSCVVFHLVSAAGAAPPRTQPSGANQRAVYRAALDLCPFQDSGVPIGAIIDRAVSDSLIDPGALGAKRKLANQRANLMRAAESLCENGHLYRDGQRIHLTQPDASSASFASNEEN